MKWTRRQSQIFTAIVGLGLIVGRKVTGVTMGKLGAHGHTTLTNAVTVVGNLLTGFFPSSLGMIANGFLGWVGGQRMNGTKQMLTGAALDRG